MKLNSKSLTGKECVCTCWDCMNRGHQELHCNSKSTESISINGEWHDVESANYSNIHPNGTCQYCHVEVGVSTLQPKGKKTLQINKSKQQDWKYRWGVLVLDIFLKSKPKAQ